MLRFMKLIKADGWKMSAIMLAALYLGSFAVMRHYEPPDKGLVQSFWWYFIVTITTIGYGDYTPVTPQGRAAMVVVMIFGVVSFTILASYIAGAAGVVLKKAIEGKIKFRMKNHTVIIGYDPTLTRNLVAELMSDKTWKDKLVLCFGHEQAERNPLQDHIERVVSGDLTSDDVMDRACVSTASSVAIIGDTDYQTLAIALSVKEAAPDTCHIVAALHDLDGYHSKLRKVSPRIECVPRVAYWISLGLQDPGSTSVIMRIMTKIDGGSCYKIAVPEGVNSVSFIDALLFFKKRHNATIIGMASSNAFDAEVRENPPVDSILRGGMALYYIADDRITKDIEWGKIGAAV